MVRRAQVADAAEVARLLHDFNSEFGAYTPGVERLTERVRELIGRGAVTVLLGGDAPDGVAVLRFRPSLWSESADAYLEELYVAPERRGQGLGRALLGAVLGAARAAGASRIELNTSEDDGAARALYERCGFTDRERPPDGPVMLFYERDL